jgi:hypothetical protein
MVANKKRDEGCERWWRQEARSKGKARQLR